MLIEITQEHRGLLILTKRAEGQLYTHYVCNSAKGTCTKTDGKSMTQNHKGCVIVMQPHVFVFLCHFLDVLSEILPFL